MTAESIFSLLTMAKGDSTARVHPVLLPENEPLPAITYQVVGGSSEPTFETSGWQRLRLQVDVFGPYSRGRDGYRAASGIRETLVAALDGYAGVLSDGTMLQQVEYIQPIDGFQQDARQYRCGVEFYLYFTMYQGQEVDVITPPPTPTSLTAGVTVSQGLAVAVQAGAGVPADSGTLGLPAIAIATAGALGGADLSVQYSGPLAFSGWNFTTGEPVFVGPRGVLTQTPPSSGYLQVVGYPISATTLLIDIQEPITL